MNKIHKIKKKILLIILKWRKLKFLQAKYRADYIICPFIQFFCGENCIFFCNELLTYYMPENAYTMQDDKKF